MNWRERADEAYALAQEQTDTHTRQALRTIGDIYTALDLGVGIVPPSSMVASELAGASEDAKHRVEEAISKLENGVHALRKLKVKNVAEELSGREN